MLCIACEGGRKRNEERRKEKGEQGFRQQEDWRKLEGERGSSNISSSHSSSSGKAV